MREPISALDAARLANQALAHGFIERVLQWRSVRVPDRTDELSIELGPDHGSDRQH